MYKYNSKYGQKQTEGITNSSSSNDAVSQNRFMKKSKENNHTGASLSRRNDINCSDVIAMAIDEQGPNDDLDDDVFGSNEEEKQQTHCYHSDNDGGDGDGDGDDASNYDGNAGNYRCGDDQDDPMLIYDYLLSRLNLSIHKELSIKSTMNTLKYMFYHMKCGIFVMIRDNKVVIFCPFVNKDYKNTWGEKTLKFGCRDGKKGMSFLLYDPVYVYILRCPLTSRYFMMTADDIQFITL